MPRLFAALILSTIAGAAAAEPPPSGPPVPAPTLPTCKPNQLNAPCKVDLGLYISTNTIRNIAQAKVDSINAYLEAQGHWSRVSIEELKQWRPQRFATDTPNQPNSFYVRVPYILSIKVNIPATSDRHIHIPIDLNVFCDNWHTNAGKVTFRTQPGPASFEGGNILEDVFNVGNYIDAQVRGPFLAPAAVTTELPNSKCAAIDGSDMATQDTGDDTIIWTVPRHQVIVADAAAKPTIEVTFNSLKRLAAHSLGNGILYAETENILLNAYANYDGRQMSLTMREGDDVPLNLPAILLDARKYDQLVVIGTIDQQSNNPNDSGFAVKPRSASFGPGQHIVQIPKWYSRPPNQFNHKPTWVRVPAYELRYTVRYLNSGVLASDEGTGSVTPPGGGNPLGGTQPILVSP